MPSMRLHVPLLQRYVFGELLRVFCFVLLCLTVLLVFVGVFQQASESGLGPEQLVHILPFIIPSLLPFTIPAALLLTVSLVYGRLAGDYEITAAKAAGINVLSLLWPSFFIGAALSVFSLVLADQAIPWAVANIQRTVVTAMEDIILERLRTEHQFGDRQRGLHVSVGGVEGRRLIRPVFTYLHGKDRTATLIAEEATIELDFEHEQVLVHIKNGSMELPGQNRVVIREDTQPIRWKADDGQLKPRHLPIRQIGRELQRSFQARRDTEDRAVIEAAFAMTQGEFFRLADPGKTRRRELRQNQQRVFQLNTEVHSRYALACSCLFFVLVGSPLAVLKAQSRFLTSFLYCFVPIITGYYPLVLGMMTQAKRGNVDPAWAMWVANAALAVAGWLLLRRVVRH
jgi:lipopolysaccharide export system permease protein